MKTIDNFHFFYIIPIICLYFNIPQNNLLKVLDSDRIQKTILISHLKNIHRETSNKFSIIQFIQNTLNILLYMEKKTITVIIGVAKISSKINIIEYILPLIDHLLIPKGKIVEYYKKTFISNFFNCTLFIINLKGAFSMVGVRDSILSIKKYKNKISYISTGVGAMLDFLKGKTFFRIETYC